MVWEGMEFTLFFFGKSSFIILFLSTKQPPKEENRSKKNVVFWKENTFLPCFVYTFCARSSDKKVMVYSTNSRNFIHYENIFHYNLRFIYYLLATLTPTILFMSYFRCVRARDKKLFAISQWEQEREASGMKNKTKKVSNEK